MKKILQIRQIRNLRFGLLPIITFLLLFVGYGGFGQIYQNTFTGTAACPTQGNVPLMATNSTGTAVTRSTLTCNSTGDVFNSTTLNITSSLSATSYIEFSATANSGYRLNLTSLSFFRQASNSAPNLLEVRYSTDGFATFTTWGAAPNSPTTGTVATWDFADFSTSISGTVTFRLYPYGTQRADGTAPAASGTGTFRIDNLTINGTVTIPTITSTGTLNQVNTTYGTASTTPTSFTTSGANLTNDILVTPPAGYEVSQTVGGTSGYAATQTLTQSGGTLASTTIYVRLKADATVAGSPYSGNIVLTSTGATSVNVATVSSTVTAKALTINGLTATDKVYDRTTTATFTGTPTYVGLVNSETFNVAGTPTASFTTASVGTAKSVTVAGYTAPSNNYSLQPTGLTANITQKPLTVTGTIAANKIYDGNITSTLSGASLIGVISPDDVSVNGNGTFASASVADGISITTSLVLGGTSSSNYSLTQPTGLSANITTKSLEIKGLTANDKVFDGTTTATLSGTAVLNGVITGEEANVTLVGTPTAIFAQSTVGNAITVTVTGYSLAGSASGNYTVSQPTGLKANITNSPPPVINSALTATATYGVVSTSYFITATNSPTSYNATGLPTGLNINTSTGEILGTPTNIASSPFSVTISATNDGGTGTATLTYTITPKTLTVNSPSVPNKVYDRTNVAIINGDLSGKVGSDVVTLNRTGTFSQITVGSGLAVTSTATLSGADAAKYTLIQPTGLTGEIVVKPIMVLNASISSKMYDGTNTATLVGTMLGGVLSPDEVTLTGGAIFTSIDVANGINVNTSSLILGGADAGNYIALPVTNGLTGNITPKSLSVSGLLVRSKVYDGNTTEILTGTPILSGIIGTDDVNVSGTPSANFDTKNIGTSKPITVTGYTLSGSKSGNYTVSQPTGLTGNITVAFLTIASAAASNKTYDGNNVATLTGTLSGIIGTETVTPNLSGTFSQIGVETGLAVTSTSTISGLDAGNYSLTQPTGLSANITTKSLEIKGLTANDKVFDGTTTATLSGTAVLNGVITGEEANVTLVGTPTAIFAQSTVGNAITVTVTGYSLAGSASGNYTVSQPTGLKANITNSPPPVINSALTATATYGIVSTSYFITATNSPTSYNATGLPTGLNINTSTGEISGTPTNIASSPFSVTISATNDGGTGTATLTYTITPKTLTVNSPSVPNKVYDRTNVATISGTLIGVVNSDVVGLNGTGTFSQIGVGSNLSVTSTSTLIGADATKYTLTQPTGLTGEIIVKSLAISSASVSPKVYDGTNMATLSSNTLNGIISPDVVSLTGEVTFTSVNVANNISINTSSLTLAGSDAGNYSLTQPTGLSANITAKQLTITNLTANSKFFDGTNTATLLGTVTLNGIIGTDNVSIAGIPTATFDNRNIGTAKPITITGYSLTGSASINYSVIQPTGLTANITALTLTVTNPVAQNKVFDGNTNATITGTLAGIISPDVVTFIGTGTFTSSAVGNGIVVTSTSTLGGAGAGNYTFTQPTGLTANITAPQFTTGNIAVLVTLSSAVTSNTAANIIELNTSSSNQSGILYSIPSTGSNSLRFSGSASSTGYLTNSNDGSLLLFTGHNTTNTSANVNTLQTVKAVGTINYTGTFNVATTYSGTGTNQTRGAATLDNLNYYIGDQGGFYTNNAISASPTGNIRSIKSFGGTVYAFTSSTTLPPVGIISATTGGTFTALPGLVNGAATRQDFYLISSGSNGNSFDVLYVLDANSATAGTIFKYSLVSGSWVANGTYTTTFGGFGLSSKKAGTGAELFISTGTGATTANNVIKLTDAAGYNSLINITTANNLILYTAATGTIVKGIAFSPILAPTSVSLSVSSNTGTEAGTTVITVTATASAPVVGNQTVSLGVTGTNITAGDYTLSNSTITIPNGNTTGSVTFTIVDDVLAENTEIAILTISNPSSGVLLGSPITQNITISDNDNTAPTIAIDVTTTSNYVDGGITVSPAGSFAASGVLNDPTDPVKNLGIDFTIGDAETAVGSLTVTATSSNLTVLPGANLNLTGLGSLRNLKITPNAEGVADVIISVNDGTTTTSFTISYASSNASINPTTTRFHSGTSDASTAQMIDNNLMIVGDDENQALRLYNRQNSGLPFNSFDFTTSFGLTDASAGVLREVDIEASAKVGNRIYWLGSHSNAANGNARPNRSRFFATDISGTGNATMLSYVGRYDNLKTELLAWDASNGHGLGANYLGLAASAATNKTPETADGSGFNIEGFEIAPNNSTAYICFRAPLQTTTTRTKALIIPLTNFANLVSGNPTSTTATFGTPIQLDLGGRAIREMKKNASGEYLIIAGPHDGSTGIAPKDFRFYTWTGNPTDAPILRSANLTALNVNGSFESIVDLPSPLSATSNLQVLVDNGDAVFYGNGIPAKELSQNNQKKFRSETINLGSAAIAIGTLTGTSFCENTPISVPFTTTETFNSGNIFTAQLSDANGSFANPVDIGTLTGTVAGTINATIPAGTISGSGYRIRVISSNLVITGADNGTNLTINNCTPVTTIKSIISGNWESPSTWDLGRIPQAGDVVIIDQNHEVTLNGTGTAKKVEYQGTGKIKLNSTSSSLNTGL